MLCEKCSALVKRTDRKADDEQDTKDVYYFGAIGYSPFGHLSSEETNKHRPTSSWSGVQPATSWQSASRGLLACRSADLSRNIHILHQSFDSVQFRFGAKACFGTCQAPTDDADTPFWLSALLTNQKGCSIIRSTLYHRIDWRGPLTTSHSHGGSTMQSHIGHIQFNVEAANLPFYRDLTAFLGWQTLYDTAEFIGVADPSGTSLWFIGYVKAVSNDYEGPGLNHLAFSVPAQADVDAAAAFLTARGVKHLFETPRHRPDSPRRGLHLLPGDVRITGPYPVRDCLHRTERRRCRLNERGLSRIGVQVTLAAADRRGYARIKDRRCHKSVSIRAYPRHLPVCTSRFHGNRVCRSVRPCAHAVALTPGWTNCGPGRLPPVAPPHKSHVLFPENTQGAYNAPR